MPSSPLRARSAATVALVAATLTALAGCGGGGNGDDYAATWNGACRDLKQAQTRFVDEAQRLVPRQGGDPKALARQLRKPIDTLAEAREKALRRIRDADAPDEFSDFQDETAKAADDAIEQVQTIKRRVRDGDVTGNVRMTATRFPSLPADLAKKAEACRSGTGL
ncbi:hypothetical protein [Patulibacter defluvii]|uniref:hypothetical protein n=1 Tax=Patulibacter defluvii TaxID=3095358 RepID=UPI002A74C07D|nr:hypothetical protein [Patulibacter sp. DM4]